MAKLTKRFVERVAPADKDLVLWDDVLPGFGLRVKASGVRSYVIQYRNVQGRSRRFTIGRHGILTPDEARKIAKDKLRAVAAGEDPAADRKAARSALDMAALCDRYLEEHVAVHNKPKTEKGCRSVVDLYIKPSLGSRKVAGVDFADVDKLHRSMKDTPRQANLTLSVLSKMLNLAERWEYRPLGSNPCKLIERYPENERERFLSEKELARLGAALDAAEKDGSASLDVCNALRLLALTGCRLNEVLGLRWDDVDFASSSLWLQDAKSGPRSHSVGALALALLDTIPRVDGSPAVFHGGDDGRLADFTLQKAWRGQKARPKQKAAPGQKAQPGQKAKHGIRDVAGLKDVRIHDLRHTVGTYASQTGANAFLIRDKLGHSAVATTNRYVNKSDGPLRVLSDKVESRIGAAMRGEEPAEVVELHPGAGSRGA